MCIYASTFLQIVTTFYTHWGGMQDSYAKIMDKYQSSTIYQPNTHILNQYYLLINKLKKKLSVFETFKQKMNRYPCRTNRMCMARVNASSPCEVISNVNMSLQTSCLGCTHCLKLQLCCVSNFMNHCL